MGHLPRRMGHRPHMYDASMVHVCSMHAACMEHVCHMYVACMLHVCCMHAACTLHVCRSLRSRHRWEGPPRCRSASCNIAHVLHVCMHVSSSMSHACCMYIGCLRVSRTFVVRMLCRVLCCACLRAKRAGCVACGIHVECCIGWLAAECRARTGTSCRRSSDFASRILSFLSSQPTATCFRS